MIVAASAVTAIVGSVLLAMRHPAETATTRGITAMLSVPGHPGSVAAGGDVLWIALKGDARMPVGDRPLLRLDLATGTVVQTVRLGGEVSCLARDGARLIASVTPSGEGRLGPRRLVALDWRSGAVLGLGKSHFNDTDARVVDGPVDQVVRAGNSLWALEVQPGRLLRLDPSTLATSSAPIRLTNGRTLGLAAGEGYVWVTAADTGELLRVDPATGAVKRLHVGGFPVGIVVAGGSVWLADRSGGNIIRFDPSMLKPVGDPIRVGAKPSGLAPAGGSLFVTDADAGTIARVDMRTGRTVGPLIRIARPANDDEVPALASSGESVWVSSFASSTVTRITPQRSLAARFSAVTFEGAGDGPVSPVTNGGIAGSGHFAATGAISDKGTYTSYRRVVGEIATVRTVMFGKSGTITVVTRIHLGRESPAPWTVASGTKSYQGLRGEGTVIVDNYLSDPYTFVLKGSISR